MDDKKEVIEDLIPQNKKKRKEPPKPWGKKERWIVFSMFLGSILFAAALSGVARNWKFPGLPRFDLNSIKPDFKFFEPEIIHLGGKDEDTSQKIEKIKSDFEEKTRDLSGLYALYVYDLENDYGFGIYADNSQQAASLIKLPVMVAIYQMAENGELDLDSKPTGSTSTYREMVRLMGKESHNGAFNTAVKSLGTDIVNKTISDLGMSRTDYSDNKTSASDIGNLFRKLYDGELMGDDNGDEFLSFLTDTKFESWLTPGIPEGIRIAHKYGREVHVVNDAGIVYAQKPYIVVIMSDGAVESEADEIFPSLSEIIFRSMSGE